MKIIFDEIIRLAKEDGAQIYFPEIVDSPLGRKQDCDSKVFDHEYIVQNGSEDNYYGYIYYPINDGKYLKVGFSL